MQNAIEISSLRFHYGHNKGPICALNGITCCFRKSCINGLAGPDASGKTTLLRILAGLLIPDAGEAMIYGKKPESLTGQTGYMPQRFGLYEDLSVRANLRLQAKLRGLGPEEEERRSCQLLEFTGLGPFLERLAGDLSGGMKQKLGIACALMGSPGVLLLDEPGVGVDPVSRRDTGWALPCACIRRFIFY